MIKRKLQVFISSTYLDLKNERQAAVEAILNYGHIPAGMELFCAGNNSQFETIMKWIDQSDVYMLILGGRYGSIEETTGWSYTHLEYEYAIRKKIPVFTLVLSDDFLIRKASIENNILESKNQERYKSFKKYVLTTKMVRFIDDIKDIQAEIFKSLKAIEENYKLSGWVPGSLLDGIVGTDVINSNSTVEDMEKQKISLKRRIDLLEKQIQNKIKKRNDRNLNEALEECVVINYFKRMFFCGVNWHSRDRYHIGSVKLKDLFFDISLYLQNGEKPINLMKRKMSRDILERVMKDDFLEGYIGDPYKYRVLNDDLDKIIFDLINLGLIKKVKKEFFSKDIQIDVFCKLTELGRRVMKDMLKKV